MKRIVLELPWPPSVNRYWRHPSSGRLAGRHLISQEGRDYRQAVIATLHGDMEKEKMEGNCRISVTVTCYPPDKRKRDLDNLTKAVLDSLTHGGVWGDDSQIDRLLIQRAGVEKDGRLVIVIEEMV